MRHLDGVQLVAALGVLWLSVLLLVTSPLLLQLRRGTGRGPRRGGSPTPGSRASGGSSRATAPPAATSTACSPDGRRLAAADQQQLRAALSRITGPGCSGAGLAERLGTATHLGTRSTAADQPDVEAQPHEWYGHDEQLHGLGDIEAA